MNRQTPPKPETSSEDTNQRAPDPREEVEVAEANRAIRDEHSDAAHGDRPLIRPRPSALDQELAEAAPTPMPTLPMSGPDPATPVVSAVRTCPHESRRTRDAAGRP